MVRSGLGHVIGELCWVQRGSSMCVSVVDEPDRHVAEALEASTGQKASSGVQHARKGVKQAQRGHGGM